MVESMVLTGHNNAIDEFFFVIDRGLDFLSTPIIMDINQMVPTGVGMVKIPGFIKTVIKKGESIKKQISSG